MSAGSQAKNLASAAGKYRYKKYTVQPTGFWKKVSNFLSIDGERSSGVPLNNRFRWPTPGGNNPMLYDDPVTVPAADIAENPYWKRDVRRSYPRKSTITQPDVVGLLSVGSAAQPKDEVLQIGDAGNKQLVEVKEEGHRGLSAYLAKDKNAFKGVLGPNNMPPMPTSLHSTKKQYTVLGAEEQAYASSYPCRTFV